MRKGIILSGGKGTRLWPLTTVISKQLLPVYDKPMIYYPISTLMLAGIKEILIIVRKDQEYMFKELLGNGNQWGINIEYAVQKKPEGIVQAFIIGSDYIKDSSVALILGDNIFHGSDLISKLKKANKNLKKNTVFAYPVKDPERYGVINFDKHKIPKNIEEKPKNAKSRYVLTGIYFYTNEVVKNAKKVKYSDNGELEITSLNQMYLEDKNLDVQIMNRGQTWLDTGTFDSLCEASSYIQTLEHRQGLKIGSPEEVAWRNDWITDVELNKLSDNLAKSGYGDYLKSLIKEKDLYLN